MVLTIVPAGSGTSRQLLGLHAAGLAAGALVVGLVLALVGAGVRSAGAGIEAAVAATVGALALLWAPRTAGAARIGARWPRSSWQVPEQWRYTLPLPFTLFAFGFLLGVGFLTSTVLPAYWLLVGFSLVTESVAAVAGAWLVYGTTRWAVTAHATRRVLASGAIPDDIHGVRAFRWARAATLVLLAVSALSGLAVAEEAMFS